MGEDKARFRIDIPNGALRVPSGKIKYFDTKEEAEKYIEDCELSEARVVAAKTSKKSEQPDGCDNKLTIYFTDELHGRLKKYQKTRPYFMSLNSIACHAIWLFLEMHEEHLLSPKETI